MMSTWCDVEGADARAQGGRGSSRAVARALTNVNLEEVHAPATRQQPLQREHRRAVPTAALRATIVQTPAAPKRHVRAIGGSIGTDGIGVDVHAPFPAVEARRLLDGACEVDRGFDHVHVRTCHVTNRPRPAALKERPSNHELAAAAAARMRIPRLAMYAACSPRLPPISTA